MDGEDELETQPGPTAGERARSVASSTARGTAKATVASAKATRVVGAAAGRAAHRVFHLARRASHAEGAGDTGLFRLIELHAFNAAGDAAVAISLAGTLFFQVPGGDDQARGQVALFLLLTMLPFAIVAPLIGPFLDRFSHGRRWAIGTTMAIRGFLCWVLAGAIADESLAMFPAALGVLVASKAYGVTKAAAVPRLAPPALGLVKANSRISLAGITGAAISAPLAILASSIGAEWSLRYAFVVFAGATILAILLPPQVDNNEGEERVSLRSSRRSPVPRAVVLGLRANAGLRLLSGFLTLFMAFLLRTHPFDGWEDKPELLLGLVIGSAGLGSTLGVGLGNVLRGVKPSFSVRVAVLAAATMSTVTAVHYTLLTAVLLGLTAGLCQSFGKLSLDAMIQAEVPEANRSSAFARSETLLQLSWVMGAFIGIALPLKAHLGLGVIAALLVAIAVWVLTGVRTRASGPAEATPRPAEVG